MTNSSVLFFSGNNEDAAASGNPSAAVGSGALGKLPEDPQKVFRNLNQCSSDTISGG